MPLMREDADRDGEYARLGGDRREGEGGNLPWYRYGSWWMTD